MTKFEEVEVRASYLIQELEKNVRAPGYLKDLSEKECVAFALKRLFYMILELKDELKADIKSLKLEEITLTESLLAEHQNDT